MLRLPHMRSLTLLTACITVTSLGAVSTASGAPATRDLVDGSLEVLGNVDLIANTLDTYLGISWKGDEAVDLAQESLDAIRESVRQEIDEVLVDRAMTNARSVLDHEDTNLGTPAGCNNRHCGNHRLNLARIHTNTALTPFSRLVSASPASQLAAVHLIERLGVSIIAGYAVQSAAYRTIDDDSPANDFSQTISSAKRAAGSTALSLLDALQRIEGEHYPASVEALFSGVALRGSSGLTFRACYTGPSGERCATARASRRGNAARNRARQQALGGARSMRAADISARLEQDRDDIFGAADKRAELRDRLWDQVVESGQRDHCGFWVMGRTLHRGARITTCDGLHMLEFQGDGNLVLYRQFSGAVWASNTHGRGAVRADFQGDGNIVIRNAAGQPLWDTATHNRGGTMLRLLDGSGELVLVDDQLEVVRRIYTPSP